MKIFGMILGLMCSFQIVVAFEGFYVGGELGGSLIEGKQQGNTVGIFENVTPTPPQFITTPVDLGQMLTHSSLQGNLYAGYGTLWHSLYLGGEVFVQFNSSEMKADSTGFYTDLGPELYVARTQSRMRVSDVQYGFDFRPGWAVTPLTLLYGRIGVGRAQLRLRADSNYTLVQFTEVGSLPLNSSAHRTRATLRLGGGLEHHITPHLTVRGDYIFTDHGTITVARAASGIASEGDLLFLNHQNRTRLQQHAVMLGLSYYFCSSYLDCDPCPCNSPFFCGFYLGGALGGFLADEKQNENVVGYNPFFIGTLMPFSSSLHLTDKGFEGVLFLGYGWQWRWLFLGAEIFGKGSVRNSLKRTDSNSLFSFATEQVFLNTRLSLFPLQGGIDFRPGVCITPFTLLYGRVGTSAASIKSRAKATFQANLSSVFNLNDKQTKKHTHATLRLGGGIEQALCPNLHLRLDYCFTDYGKVKLKGATSGLTSIGLPVFLNYSTSYHLIDHSVLLGLSYYFR